MVGIFFFLLLSSKNLKRPSASLNVKGGMSISNISWKEVWSDLHREVRVGGIFYVSAEGGRSND